MISENKPHIDKNGLLVTLLTTKINMH